MTEKGDRFNYFCNECDWQETTQGAIYLICQKCSSSNIGYGNSVNIQLNAKQSKILIDIALKDLLPKELEKRKREEQHEKPRTSKCRG